MSLHVHHVCRAAFNYLRFIARQCKALDNSSLRRLLHLLVLSRIEYATTLLFGVSKALQSKLEAVSNAALRVLARLRKFDHLTVVRAKHSWLPLLKRQFLRYATFVYVILRHGKPSYLADHLNFCPLIRSTRASRRCLLSVPRTSTRVAERMFIVAGPTIWNSIPLDIRASPTIGIFKEKLRVHLS